MSSALKQGDNYIIKFTYQVCIVGCVNVTSLSVAQCPDMAESCVGDTDKVLYSLDLSEGSCSMADDCGTDGRMDWECTNVMSLDSLTATLTARVGNDGFAHSFITEIR